LIARKKAFEHLSSDYFMKSITGLLTVILIAVSITGAAQEEVTIVQYSSFCESATMRGAPGAIRERISEVNHVNDHLAFKAILIRGCGQPVIPTKAIRRGNVVYVTTAQLQSENLILSNGEKVVRSYLPEECECAHELRLELGTDGADTFVIDNITLEVTDEKFETQPLRYFVFRGDTTGYEDKYGRRQGYYIIERKKNMLRSHYKDGVQIRCELLSLDGELLEIAEDCYPLLKK